MESPPEKQPTQEVIPSVALNVNVAPAENKNEIVQADQIVSLCQDVLSDIATEKDEISQTFNNFSEMVFNAGDATSASKEALVNLLKIRSDLVDKKTRVMEMMLRAFQKDGPKTVTAHQHNDIHISDKRKLFQELDKQEEEEKKS